MYEITTIKTCYETMDEVQEALADGKTVYVGDDFETERVTKIERNPDGTVTIHTDENYYISKNDSPRFDYMWSEVEY